MVGWYCCCYFAVVLVVCWLGILGLVVLVVWCFVWFVVVGAAVCVWRFLRIVFTYFIASLLVWFDYMFCLVGLFGFVWFTFWIACLYFGGLCASIGCGYIHLLLVVWFGCDLGCDLFPCLLVCACLLCFVACRWFAGSGLVYVSVVLLFDSSVGVFLWLFDCFVGLAYRLRVVIWFWF